MDKLFKFQYGTETEKGFQEYSSPEYHNLEECIQTRTELRDEGYELGEIEEVRI